MRCVGFDPGGVHLGCAVLESGRGLERPRFLCGEEMAVDKDAILAVLQWQKAKASEKGHELLVGVETVSGFAHRFRKGGRTVDLSAALNAAARVGGLVEGLAAAEFLEVVSMPAVKWRRMMCGTATPTDAKVKAAVHMMVAGMRARSNPHVRDAVGTAFAVLQSRFRTESTAPALGATRARLLTTLRWRQDNGAPWRWPHEGERA